MLQNLPIRSKLTAILVPPLLALLVIGGAGIVRSLGDSQRAGRTQDLARFATRVTALVNEVQAERSLSSGHLNPTRPVGLDQLNRQRTLVDRARATFQDAAQQLELGADEARLRERITRSQAALGRLAAHRQVVDGRQIPTSQASGPFSEMVESLLDINSQVAAGADNEQLLHTAAAYTAVSQLKEATERERGIVLRTMTLGEVRPVDQQELVAATTRRDLWRSQFEAAASPGQRQLLARNTRSPQVTLAERAEDQILKGDLGGLALARGGDAEQTPFYQGITAKFDGLRRTEDALASELVNVAERARADARRSVQLYGLALALVLLLTVGLWLAMARSMVRPLRLLEATSLDVAERRLPNLVGRLQQASEPVDLEAEARPIAIDSRDEIGRVARAFNTVQRAAVRVGGEQAALRRSIADMFMNLARRSQSLIDRQIGLIDQLERKTEDPDELADLFRLDHLATRMRRNAENLIVLSGAEPARRWSEPVPLVDVVRSAIAEVEEYTRVEPLPITDLKVAGQAVGDLVHLLAELIENATSFSPPDTSVVLSGQSAASGYVLEIEDRGIGMTDAELLEANERLTNPPLVDFALSRMLGFHVVGRLAARYGIGVGLRHSWYGGVIALVLIPEGIIVRPPVADELPLEAAPGPRAVSALAPPAPAAPPAGPVGAAAGPSGNHHLPIFEAARSDWFETGEPSGTRVMPPLRPAEDGRASTATDPELAAPPAPPAPGPPLPPAPEPWAAPPEPEREPMASPRGGNGGTTYPAPPPAPFQPAFSFTRAGLPRRTPQASLAPGMQATSPPPEQPAGEPEQAAPAARSPEETRSMLSSYRSGLERGRHEAASEEDDALIGSDFSASFRSDRDAAQ